MAKASNRTLVIVLIVVFGIPAVVGCCGIVAAIAIPSFFRYTRSAKTAEARSNLLVLSQAVEAYSRDHGAPPPKAGPVPGVAPGGAKVVGAFASDPGFAALGFAPTDPVFFSYELIPDAGKVTIYAYGDLDADGAQSTFEVVCSGTPLTCAPTPVVRDEFE